MIRRRLFRSLGVGAIVLVASTAIGPAASAATQASPVDAAADADPVETLTSENAQAAPTSEPDGFADASIDIPLHKQEHALSCEAAALQMAMAALGNTVAEDDILAVLPRDTTPRTARPDGLVEWGDPDRGYVGVWDGVFARDGYGVYEGPIADVAVGYGFAGTVQGRNVDPNSLYAVVRDGWPTVVWIPYGLTVNGRGSWLTPQGTQIEYVVTEHAVVLAGTTENGVVYADPYTGRLRNAAYADFEAGMLELGNRAVTIRP